MRDGILAVLDDEGIERAHVVGSSLGGYIAQNLLVHAPERIDRVVFANTFPPNDIIAAENRTNGRILPIAPGWLVMRLFRKSIEEGVVPAADGDPLVEAFLLYESYGGMNKAQFAIPSIPA